MYVYLHPENPRERYAVGFYTPDGKWYAESYRDTAEAAAQRVSWLNGLFVVNMIEARDEDKKDVAA